MSLDQFNQLLIFIFGKMGMSNITILFIDSFLSIKVIHILLLIILYFAILIVLFGIPKFWSDIVSFVIKTVYDFRGANYIYVKGAEMKLGYHRENFF